MYIDVKSNKKNMKSNLMVKEGIKFQRIFEDNIIWEVVEIKGNLCKIYNPILLDEDYWVSLNGLNKRIKSKDYTIVYGL